MKTKITLKEKISLCEGKNFWETKAFPQYEIPSMFMCDGPHGLRRQENRSDFLGVNESRPATLSISPKTPTLPGNWRQASSGTRKKTASAPVSSILPVTIRSANVLSPIPSSTGGRYGRFI